MRFFIIVVVVEEKSCNGTRSGKSYTSRYIYGCLPLFYMVLKATYVRLSLSHALRLLTRSFSVLSSVHAPLTSHTPPPPPPLLVTTISDCVLWLSSANSNEIKSAASLPVQIQLNVQPQPIHGVCVCVFHSTLLLCSIPTGQLIYKIQMNFKTKRILLFCLIFLGLAAGFPHFFLSFFVSACIRNGRNIDIFRITLCTHHNRRAVIRSAAPSNIYRCERG